MFGLRAKRHYPIVRAIIEHREPEAAQILPVEPKFATDDDCLPLQAADLVAWCIRKGTDDPDYEGMNWLLPELHNVNGSEYPQYYDRARMDSIWAETERMVRENEFPAEIVSLRRELYP